MKPTTTQLKRICYLSKKLQNMKRPMSPETYDRFKERAERTGLAHSKRYFRLLDIDFQRMEAYRAVRDEIESFLEEMLPKGSVVNVSWMNDPKIKDEA